MDPFFTQLLWGLFFTAVAAFLAPRPKPPTPSDLDDFNIPMVREGSEVGKVYGTAWIKNPQVVWYGDLKTEAIVQTGKRRYGLFGPKSKTVTGYKYSLGMHTVMAQNLDAVLALRFADKVGWKGYKGDGARIQINRPSLFGGDKKDGGISGYIDVEMGGASQVPNDYLQDKLVVAIPAFRGVAALVWRQFYWGNSPYLKPVSVKALAVHSHFDDWYPAKALMNAETDIINSAIHIALDNSGSMYGTKWDTQISAVRGFLQTMKGKTGNSFRIVVYDEAVFASIERLQATDADIEAIRVWLAGLNDQLDGATNFEYGVASAPQFFADHEATEAYDPFAGVPILGGLFAQGSATSDEFTRRIVIFTTDGSPSSQATFDNAKATLDSIERVEVFCFNIVDTNTFYTSQMDNTPNDGVPVVSGSNPDELRTAIEGAFMSFADMNPAHILRDALIAPSSDGSGNAAEIGASFTAAADTLFSEGLGLCFRWQTVRDKRSFKSLVEQHIDGICYLDSTTGKYELKLIRNDYDAETIPVFDDSNVVEWSDDIKRPAWDELPNQIKVLFTKRANGDQGSITITNIAGVQATGRVIQEERDYGGITVESLASRVTMRDLTARTVPLWDGSFKATHLDPDTNLGSAIKINKPELGLNNIIGRIVYISDPDGRDNAVTIRFAQDKYAIDADAISSSDDVDTGIDFTAQACTYEMVEEAPYWYLQQELGQDVIDEILAASPGAGLFHATGDQPTGSHLNIDIATNSGAGWVLDGFAEFCPVSTLSTGMTAAADDLTAVMPYTQEMGTILAGTMAQIGSEYLRVDSMALDGNTVTVTFGRGCLDTVPAQHYAGDPVFFWQGLTGGNGEEYADGASVDVRLLPLSSGDRLALASAITNAVLFDSRAFRPYAPGKFQIGGSYAPAGVLAGDLAGTWNHRDRTVQITEAIDDHTAADIGPEAGTTYIPMRRMVVYHADIFGSADIFDRRDFLESSERPLPIEYDPTLGKAHTFNADDDDLFNYADLFALLDLFEDAFSNNVIALEFGVKSSRPIDDDLFNYADLFSMSDLFVTAYESLQAPWIRCLPLLPPINLTSQGV